MATFTLIYELPNPTGHLLYKVRYRLSGDSSWTSFQTSGTTIDTPQLLDNRIYDFQVQNINNSDNPYSLTDQYIGITDPGPTISPLSATVSYTFGNLSSDMDSYTATIALYSNPGGIIATHVLSPATIVSDTFTGLTTSTPYILTITPAANQFYRTFTYLFSTTQTGLCASVQNIIATLS